MCTDIFLYSLESIQSRGYTVSREWRVISFNLKKGRVASILGFKAHLLKEWDCFAVMVRIMNNSGNTWLCKLFLKAIYSADYNNEQF